MAKIARPIKKAPARKRVPPLMRRALPARAVPGTVIGTLTSVGAGGELRVDLPAEGRAGVAARATIALDARHVGREVLVALPAGRAAPVVCGLLRRPGDAGDVDVEVDGERVVLTGRREVVLSCGKARIVLSADGRIAITGAHLLAAASGLHRIRGGAVQIN